MPQFDYPRIITTPFAQSGTKNIIPAEHLTFGAASLSLGFPPETQQPEEAGGIPPDRADFNGALYLESSHTVYQALGGRYKFSPAVAVAGGYPTGAVLAHDNPAIPFMLRSLKDNNTDNFNAAPEVIGVSWAVEAQGTSLWNEKTVYHAPCLVFSESGTLYRCLQDNGPGTAGGVRLPNLSPDFWADMLSRYELCEFYAFRHPALRPGFLPAQGGLVENANELCPEAWAYLQTAAGQLLCKSEVDWQAASQAVWYTLADGTQIGWEGIGGVPYYALNLATGALRLPDLRGMYIEAAGFDSLGVGGVHGDAIRNIDGWLQAGTMGGDGRLFRHISSGYSSSNGGGNYTIRYSFDASRVVPVADVNRPRAWGALACVYLGTPK